MPIFSLLFFASLFVSPLSATLQCSGGPTDNSDSCDYEYQQNTCGDLITVEQCSSSSTTAYTAVSSSVTSASVASNSSYSSASAPGAASTTSQSSLSSSVYDSQSSFSNGESSATTAAYYSSYSASSDSSTDPSSSDSIASTATAYASESTANYSQQQDMSSTAASSSSAYSISNSTASGSATSTPSSAVSSSALSNTSSSSDEYCISVLIQELERIKYAVLNSSQQVIFELCIVDIRVIIADLSLTVSQRISACAYRISRCFAEYPDIDVACRFQQISTWGYVNDFCAVGQDLDSQQADYLITVNGNNQTNLTIAIESGCAGDVCGSGSSAIIGHALEKIRYGLRRNIGSWRREQKLGWVKEVLEKYLFGRNPGYRSCVENVTIAGYGTVGQFLFMCQVYEVTSNLGSRVLNGNSQQCPLIQSVQQAINSSANSTNTTTLQEAQAFCNNLTAFFGQQTDVQLRLAFVSSQYSSCSRTTRLFLQRISIQGTLSIHFYNVIQASHFCSASGCGNITLGPSMPTPENMVAIDSGSNSTELTDCFQLYYNNLTNTQRLTFNSYFNSVRNCIWNNAANASAAVSCCTGYINAAYTNNAAQRRVFLATEFYTYFVNETVSAISAGTIGSFCKCS